MIRRLLFIVPVLAIAIAGGAFWALWAGPGPNAAPLTLIVEEGSSVARVADQLAEADAIRGDSRSFRAFARVFGSRDPIQAGEFRIPPRLSAAGILDLLQHGRPVQRFITIPEGMPSVMVRDRLLGIPWRTGPVDVPEEGSVLPDTYSYQRGEARAAVLARMQAAMRRELARLWAARKPGAAVRTPAEAIILASIVEKETA